ncbi:PH domain-containing protein [Streptomyces sp. JH002]|uniref:PH domain-containing protein n=1 Tax=Streptomyces sp. JH002 TaxID=2763259 RepID=UPI003D804A0B
MQEIEYQLRQRRSSLIIAWVLGGAGLLSLAVITVLLATGREREWPVLLVMCSFPVMMSPAIPWIIWLAHGRTVVDAHGIRTSRPLRHRSCPWQDVAHIGIRRSGLPGQEELKIVVTRTDGRPLKLPAPRDYTAAPDPGFPQAFHEIVQRWRTATNPYRRPSP